MQGRDEFPWLFDSLGLPYAPYRGFEFDWSGAVDLGGWTSPFVFSLGSQPAGRKAQLMESDIPADHYDSPLSHHAQQATALRYMTESAGFDNLVRLRATFSDGTYDLYLLVDVQWWEEQPVGKALVHHPKTR